MAVIADTHRSSQTDQTALQDTNQDDDYQGNSSRAVPDWAENSPSYLALVRVSLAILTEADKDALHASLEED